MVLVRFRRKYAPITELRGGDNMDFTFKEYITLGASIITIAIMLALVYWPKLNGRVRKDSDHRQEYCPQCGNSHKVWWRYCPVCGHKLN